MTSTFRVHVFKWLFLNLYALKWLFLNLYALKWLFFKCLCCIMFSHVSAEMAALKCLYCTMFLHTISVLKCQWWNDCFLNVFLYDILNLCRNRLRRWPHNHIASWMSVWGISRRQKNKTHDDWKKINWVFLTSEM
jgi:hypothetical protein